MMTRHSLRRRLQFSLRTLIATISVLGLWLGTIADRAHRQREAKRAIAHRGGQVWHDDQLVAGIVTRPATRGGVELVGPRFASGADRVRPFWERFLGEDYFVDVIYVDLSTAPLTDADLAPLADLPKLRFLSLANTPIADAALKHVRRLRRLERLDLSGTNVTDAGLAHLAGLKSLVDLRLGSTLSTLGRLDGATRVTDAGLEHLRKLPSLRSLSLGGAQIGDAGLRRLAGLASLELLDVRDTLVTPAGCQALKRAIPGLTIVSQQEFLLSSRQP